MLNHMYVPPKFREERLEVLHNAIEHIRFGSLITVGRDGPLLTNVPMFVDSERGPKGRIVGHIARANQQWQETDARYAAVAAFLGPQSYITPSWYATKQLSGKVVPTWMYLAVQARGPIEFFQDVERLRALVEASTFKQEAGRSKPWAVTDAPSDYVNQQLQSIVGFEIQIESIIGSWKLAQRKTEGDRTGTADGLASEEAIELSELVREKP